MTLDPAGFDTKPVGELAAHHLSGTLTAQKEDFYLPQRRLLYHNPNNLNNSPEPLPLFLRVARLTVMSLLELGTHATCCFSQRPAPLCRLIPLLSPLSNKSCAAPPCLFVLSLFL